MTVSLDRSDSIYLRLRQHRAPDWRAAQPLRQELERILVVIPARNEEETIVPAIQRLQAAGLSQIRVVDNGSCDRTASLAQAAGAQVICEPKPGYGQACWQGLQRLDRSIDWILFCDADGSDDLGRLSEFFALRSRHDFILGDRRATYNGRKSLTPVQNFGNWLSTQLIALGWGYQYNDLGPLRMIRREALEQIGMRDRGFGWTVEMQARAVELGLRIVEIPVGYRDRQGGQSKISGTLKGSLQAGTIILATLGQLYWQRLTRRRA